jgi:hypothetical protein
MAAKKRHDWYAALSHALTSGFAIPLILATAYAYALVPLLGIDTATPYSALVSGLIALCSIWLGVKYSSVYLRRAYTLESRRRIVPLASFFFLLMLAAVAVPGLAEEDGSGYRAISAVSALLSVCVFYYVSRRELVDGKA